MTKREFCELMAAGHQEAADIIERASLGLDDSRFAALENNKAMARAFRALAKEQPND